MKTHAEVKSQVEKEMHQPGGTTCPTCDQHVQVYKRFLNGPMSVALIWISKYFDKPGCEEWLHVENYLKSIPDLSASIRGDFAKLRHFGLLEKMEAVRDDGSFRNGHYKITEKGKLYVKGEYNAPKYCLEYNGKCLELATETINIKKALKEKFDYNKLMNT